MCWNCRYDRRYRKGDQFEALIAQPVFNGIKYQYGIVLHALRLLSDVHSNDLSWRIFSSCSAFSSLVPVRMTPLADTAG